MAQGIARGRRHRGAGLAEYALGVSLVLVGGLGAASTMQEESADALEQRGSSIGAPDLDEPAETTTTTTLPPSGSDGTTTTTAPPTPPSSTVASAQSTSHASDNKWTATVVISITDGTNPVHKAALTATWQQNPGGSITSVTCSTQPNGTCTFTMRNLGRIGSSHHVASVTFRLTSVTPNGGTTTNPNLSVTVFEPTS